MLHEAFSGICHAQPTWLLMTGYSTFEIALLSLCRMQCGLRRPDASAVTQPL